MLWIINAIFLSRKIKSEYQLGKSKMKPSFRYAVGEKFSNYQVKRQIVQGELIEDYLLIDEKGETFFMRVLVSHAPKSAKFSLSLAYIVAPSGCSSQECGQLVI